MLPERMNEVELQRIRTLCNMERTSSYLGSGRQQRTETMQQSRKLDSKEASALPRRHGHRNGIFGRSKKEREGYQLGKRALAKILTYSESMCRQLCSFCTACGLQSKGCVHVPTNSLSWPHKHRMGRKIRGSSRVKEEVTNCC